MNKLYLLKKFSFFCYIFFVMLLLNSCGTISKISSNIKHQIGTAFNKNKKKVEENLFSLLREAERDFIKGHYDIAYREYKKIRDRYPGTPQSILAELRMADCKFWEGEYLEAISIYEEFEKFYPDNEAIPYVIYQIGTCYYKLKLPYDRDQTYTKKAIEAFQRLLQNFPQNPYKFEAQKKIKELREILAQHEFYVAKFYYRIKYYRSAYGRLLYIINNYPDTYTYQKAKKLILTYYQKALLETKELSEGKKKDFWGEKVP